MDTTLRGTDRVNKINNDILQNGGVSSAPTINPKDLPGYDPVNDTPSSLYRIPSIISSNNLSSTSPLALPTSNTSSPSVGVIASSLQAQAEAEKQAEANVKAQEQAASVGTAQAQKEGVLDTVKRLLGREATITTDMSNSPENTQLLTEQKTLSELNNQIADQNVRLRAEQDLIKGRGDISQDAQNGLLNNVNDTYGRRLADLAIRQSAATGNVTRLQASLKDALALKLAPLEKEIQYYKDFAIQNLDNLTTQEKEKLNRIIAEKKTIADKTAADQKILSDTITEALKNGVKIPDYAIQEAQANPSQTPQILAKYGISLANPLDQAYKQSQIDKNNADAYKTLVEAGQNGAPVVKRVGPNGETLPPTAEDKALQVILGSGKFTKDQSKAVTNAINNGEDPFTVIKNQAKNIMGQTEATTVTKYETAQNALNDLKTALDSYYANGGKTNIFSGNYEKVINKLGEVNNPKLVDLATQIQAQLQVYRNAVSGTAYSAQEGADINTIFPGINKTQGLNEAILKGREAAFNSTIDGTYRATLGSTYDELKKGQKTQETDTKITPFEVITGNGKKLDLSQFDKK